MKLAKLKLFKQDLNNLKWLQRILIKTNIKLITIYYKEISNSDQIIKAENY